jgi:NhaP-type Na+/H+ or K+/H+ antiporter
VTTDQVLAVVGLILVLAAGSQVLASRLHIPAALLVGMSGPAALLTGAILVVSGPTVIGPLLNTIRPAERLQRVHLGKGH